MKTRRSVDGRLLIATSHPPAFSMVITACRIVRRYSYCCWRLVNMPGRLSAAASFRTLWKTPELTVLTRLSPGEAVCGFYGGTFDHLIHKLIAAQAQTKVTTSLAAGQTKCVYSIQFEGAL